MIKGETFDLLDAIGRTVRKVPRLFGGIQVSFPLPLFLMFAPLHFHGCRLLPVVTSYNSLLFNEEEDQHPLPLRALLGKTE